MPDPLIPEYETPEGKRPAPPPPLPRADVPGFLSLANFGGALLAFCGGLAGAFFDPHSGEDQGMLGYIMVMVVPVAFGCPLGLLLGLVGLRDRPANLSAVGVCCNGVALLLFFLWRLA